MTIDQNYTLDNYTFPSQAASQADYEMMAKIGGSAESSMIFTLIVPFCFMLFMSMSMGRVWSLYLMLQVTSNINNFSVLLIPANTQYILFILANVSNFSVLKEANV